MNNFIHDKKRNRYYVLKQDLKELLELKKLEFYLADEHYDPLGEVVRVTDLSGEHGNKFLNKLKINSDS
jgi:hypothetical protein